MVLLAYLKRQWKLLLLRAVAAHRTRLLAKERDKLEDMTDY